MKYYLLTEDNYPEPVAIKNLEKWIAEKVQDYGETIPETGELYADFLEENLQEVTEQIYQKLIIAYNEALDDDDWDNYFTIVEDL